ncbi:MAG TPA: M48 family metalloprotease [Trebonia sp.]
MRAALVLAVYAVAVAWCLPAPLARLTARGISPRFGLTVWLVAMASVLASLGGALTFLIRTVAADWPRLSQAVCREVAGNACTPVVYRSALYELGLAVLLALASLGALAAAWRYGHRVRRARRRTAEHATAARIVGRALPGAGPAGAVVLDDARPAAYCVAGRPPVIVVTRGTLDVLDDAQLAAVLAHERAHLSGRHHVLVLAVRALAAAFPCVPLFSAGAGAVALLAEMRADDAAARPAVGRPGGRGALIAALVTIATAQAPPSDGALRGGALAAAAYAVPARVERMLTPATPARRAVFASALTAVTALLLLTPAAIPVLLP